MPLFLSAAAESLGPNAQVPEENEPRWPALIAMLATTGLYFALPASLAVGPRWLLLALISVLLIPTIASYRWRIYRMNHLLGFLLAGTITVFLIGSLALLIHAMIAGKETPTVMLRSAAALWVTNILVFALWYWRLDAGGPHIRELKLGHTDGAFLFPQMSMTPELKEMTGETNWSPNFWDYLFLAFNTSTALSPADTAVLSRWAKLLSMLQAMISLCVIALLAARAVNIIGSS
jgi:uncharacterized membrane protein